MGAGWHSPVVVGRDEELDVLRQAVIRARQGSGGMMLVTGEAGIGKSRLLEEASGYARTLGMAVLAGRAVEGGGPYRPVAEAFSARLRDAAVPVPDELRPFRPALARLLPGWLPDEPVTGVDPVVVLGEGVLRLLRIVAGQEGAIVVLEDLHWADRDTFTLLDYLSSPLAEIPVALLASARSDEDQPELLRRLAWRTGLRRVPLTRLDPEDVHRVATACAGAPLPVPVVDFLIGAAEGLPFLVEELLASLAESGAVADGAVADGAVADGAGQAGRGTLAVEVPRTLAELVHRRLARLAPQPRQVVEAAAVIGRSVDWGLLGPVTGLDEHVVVAALRAAVAAYLMEPEHDRFVWRHALMREAVLARLLPPERAVLARRAAEVLHMADKELTGPDAVLIAELYAQGGEGRLAAQVLVRSAHRAIAAGAPHSAAELLDRAAELGGGTIAAVERARMLTFTGQAAQALDVAAPALLGARGEERFELLLSLARAAVATGRWAEAEDYLRRTGRAGDPRVDAIAADAAFGAGRVDQAAALAQAAAAAARENRLAEAGCEALEVVARCAGLPDARAAAEAFRQAADLAEEHGLVPWRIRALLGLGVIELQSGKTTVLEQVRDLALDAGMLAEVAATDLLLADACACVDGPVAALERSERSAALARQVRLEQTAAMAAAQCAEAHAVAGRHDDMRAMLSLAAGTNVAPDVAAAASSALALAAILDRDLPRARSLLDDSVEKMRGHASAAPLRGWGLWALIRTVLGDRDGSARDLLRHSPVVARDVNGGALQYADAVAAGRGGDEATALSLLRSADELLTREHWWRRLLRLHVFEAAIADGWGEPVQELRRDLAGFEAAGDHRLARICRDLLRHAGAPVPRRGRGDSAVPPSLRAVGVTSREMDVLSLIAQGLTNAQIAERLFLSPRTVETHVAHLLAKTGAPDRSGLTRHLI
jgi:DNA-binding CsgD family transcriptional regulator